MRKYQKNCVFKSKVRRTRDNQYFNSNSNHNHNNNSRYSTQTFFFRRSGSGKKNIIYGSRVTIKLPIERRGETHSK